MASSQKLTWREPENTDAITTRKPNLRTYKQLYTRGSVSIPLHEKVNIMDKKRIAILFLIVLMDTAGATAMVPLIPVYVLAQFHATPFQAGLLLATYYAAQMVAAPWLGKLSDRFGRRPILLLSQAGTIISYLMIVFALPLGALLDQAGLPLGIAGGLIVIFLARILDGLTGGNVSVAQAYASDISTPEERTRALGLVGGAFGLGFILGPALVGLMALLAPSTLVAPLLVAAAVSVVTLLLTLLWLREPPRHEDGKDTSVQAAQSVPLIQVLRSLPVLLVLGTTLLMTSYMAALAGTFSMYSNQVLFAGQPAAVVVRNVGLIMTVLGLVQVFAQVVLLRPLVSRLSDGKLVLLGGLLQLVSAVGLFAVSELWAVMAFVVAFALGYGISSPTLQSLMTRFGSERMAGRLLGVYQSVSSLAFILSMVWSTYVFGYYSPQAVFAVSAGLLALAMVGSIGIVRHEPARVSAESDGQAVETTAEKESIRVTTGQLT
jgi:DHA1 family tetracycline resistance protein-like MFS transporter